MTNHQSMIVDHEADVSLTIFTSMLVDLRELVVASQELGRESGIVAADPVRSFEELDDSLDSLRMTTLLMICSSWLIDQISAVSEKASGTTSTDIRMTKSLKDQFDNCGYLKNKPLSPIDRKVHSICHRLARLDKWRC